MQLHHINIENLSSAPLNVRKVQSKNVDDLVPSIQSLGIIQPLLVRPDGTPQGYEIIAGQRRYHALQKLVGANDGGLETFGDVPCIIMQDGDDAKAVEASLSENIARLPMDEIDQFKAFNALVKQGQSIEAIANQFGITSKLVTQRLAIANLIAPILTAYPATAFSPIEHAPPLCPARLKVRAPIAHKQR